MTHLKFELDYLSQMVIQVYELQKNHIRKFAYTKKFNSLKYLTSKEEEMSR